MGAVVSPAHAAQRPRRATGTSLAAILLSLGCFAAVMALHVLRGDMDPMKRVMSEYANGSYGVVMTVAFYAFGLSALALGFRLRTALTRRGAGKIVPGLLAVTGIALLLSGAFEVGRPLVPDTIEETVHSLASVTAFVLLITAMLIFSFVAGRDPQWRSYAWRSWSLAGVAAAAAMASPWADATRWSGVVQRILGGAVLVWLVLTPLRLRANARSR